MDIENNINISFNRHKEELQNGHPPFPELLSSKLYNSIVNIKYGVNDDKMKSGTGFFMSIVINDKKYNYLITCKHVISDEYLKNKKIINILYGKRGEEKNISLKLDDKIRNIKIYDDLDLILIEIIADDNIPKDKYSSLQ